MGALHVYLEDGFDHDRVVLDLDGDERIEAEATTRYQVGLAGVVDFDVAEGSPCLLAVSVPERGLGAQLQADPDVAGHIRVSISQGALVLRPSSDPPMFA